MIEQTNSVRSYVFLLDHMICDRPYKWPWILIHFWTQDKTRFGATYNIPASTGGCSLQIFNLIFTKYIFEDTLSHFVWGFYRVIWSENIVDYSKLNKHDIRADLPAVVHGSGCFYLVCHSHWHHCVLHYQTMSREKKSSNSVTSTFIFRQWRCADQPCVWTW